MTLSSLSFGGLTHTGTTYCNPDFPDCSIFVEDNKEKVATSLFFDSYALRSRNMNIDQNNTGVGINASFRLAGVTALLGSHPTWLNTTDIDPGLDSLSGLELTIDYLGFGGADFSLRYTVSNLSIVNEANIAAPVPEPEIYAMMGIGLGLLGWVGRRRKQQASA